MDSDSARIPMDSDLAGIPSAYGRRGFDFGRFGPRGSWLQRTLLCMGNSYPTGSRLTSQQAAGIWSARISALVDVAPHGELGFREMGVGRSGGIDWV